MNAQPASESETIEETDNLTFGEEYTWETGLTVTIAQPTSFEPSRSAAYDKQAPSNLSFVVTIINQTGRNYDPSQFSATVQSGNAEAVQVFDAEQGYNGPPATVLLDGRESQFHIGFGVQNPDDLVLQVTPSFRYRPSIWADLAPESAADDAEIEAPQDADPSTEPAPEPEETPRPKHISGLCEDVIDMNLKHIQFNWKYMVKQDAEKQTVESLHSILALHKDLADTVCPGRAELAEFVDQVGELDPGDETDAAASAGNAWLVAVGMSDEAFS